MTRQYPDPDRNLNRNWNAVRFRGQMPATGAGESFFDESLLDLIDDLEVGWCLPYEQ